MSQGAESFRATLIRGVMGAGALHIVQRALALVTAILLARLLGAVDYGYYAFAMAVIGVLAVPALLGLPQLITRELAANQAKAEWSLMVGLRRRSTQIAVIAILIATAVGYGLLLGAGHVPAIEPLTFALALALLPLMIVMEIMSSLLRGLRRVVQGLWPVAALKPILVVLPVGIVMLAGRSLSPPIAIVLNIAASVVAIVALWIMLARHWPSAAAAAAPEYRTKHWLKSLLPFTMLGAANIVTQKTDIVMLGAMTSAADVGVYNIAVQGAMLVSFGFAAVNAVLAPNISRFYVQRDMARLQRLLSVSSLVILGIAILVLGVLALFGEALIDLVFGAEFRRGYPALLILGVGQLINASVGSVGTFLSMTRHENDTLRAIVVAAIVNVVLNALLIPAYGMIGAAIATMTATILWNLIMAIAVYRRLGLVPGPLYLKKKAST